MQIALAVISVLLIIAVFLSRVKNDFWVYKVLEYPRLQKLAIVVIIMACWAFFWPMDHTIYYVIFAGLGISIIYLLYKIWPYTTIAKKEMKRVREVSKDNELKIFTANVFQDNHQYDRMLQQIKDMNPDMVFLLETNHAWEKAMSQLKGDYPYTLSAPLENTYGLLFYSKLKIENGKVDYLVKGDIPSVHGMIELRSGRKVMMWGLHPEPPVPGENLYSTAKDKELMIVALRVRECKLPAIVFGDLNDVAWSHTTELFRKTSGMLDPRRGRGYYNTFSAHSHFIRFPLDYIFCTKEFGLVKMQRMPKNGSDHFAMFTHICLNNEAEQQHDEPVADGEEISEANEIAAQPVKE